MKASTPVARWTWGRDHDETDVVGLCLRDQLAAYDVLSAHRLALGAPVIRVRVAEGGNPRNLLFDKNVESIGQQPHIEAKRIADEVQARRQAGRIGYAKTAIECAGLIGRRGAEVVEESLFRLTTHAYPDYVTTALVTFSDAWMQYDLRGNPQPDVYAANRMQLADALRDLSVALDSETDPEDPTRFGRPTNSGIDNLYEPDGRPSDVWSRYEISSGTDPQ